jgi:hypothetical protein
MWQDTDKTDPRTALVDAYADGHAYERRRIERGMAFQLYVPEKLKYLGITMGWLAALVPIYGLAPDSTHQLLPAVSPFQASPRVLILAVASYLFLLIAALVLTVTGLYHVRQHPVTDRQADWILNFEGFASLLGFVTGLCGTGLTVGVFLLPLVGGLERYVSVMNGINPFAAWQSPLTVGSVGTVAFCTALLLVLLGRLLGDRYPYPER